MVAEELIEKNYADVLTPPKIALRADEERHVYTVEDIQKLVKGLKAVADNGELVDRPERYWLPMIGLFSGLRLNEICQLHIGDVVDEGGIYCFKVQSEEDGTKNVKTAAAIRTVPVHKTLIELGFIEYFKECVKSGQPRLWMKLTLDSRGKYNRNFSNWFLKSISGEGFLRTYVTTDDRKDFHSFRHTFVNTLKQADVDEVKIAELVGHTNKSMTTGRYGKLYKIAKMKVTVDSLHYEGVRFN